MSVAGLLSLAVIGFLFIGIVLLVFVNQKNTGTPYILVLSFAHDTSGNEALQLIDIQTRKNLIKSKTVSDEGIEVTVEVSRKVLPLWEDTLSLAINNIYVINRNNSTIVLETPSSLSSEADEVDGSVGWTVFLPTRELEFPIELIFEVTLITVDNRSINAVIRLPWIPDGVSPLIPWQEQILP